MLRSPLLLALAWVVTRALELARWWHAPRRSLGDVGHYWHSLSTNPLRQALPEYPLPVAWLMTPMRLLAGGSQQHFAALFAVVMTLADIIAVVLLWRRGSILGAWCWTIFSALLSCELLWFRFDVLTATLVLAALLVRRQHPATAGALVAVGAAFKLWPVLLVAAMWRRGAAGRRFLAGVLGTGLLVVVVGCLTSGWDRLVSPLRWQQDRGLQIESIVATPVMLMRAHRPRLWHTALSHYLAYEIQGPHVGTAMAVASVLNLLVGVLALAMFVQSWRIGSPVTLRANRDDDAHMAMASAALIGAFMVANKTFSPQYLYWLMAPVVVVLMRRREAGRWRAGVLTLLVLAAAALTGWFFPMHYGPLHRAIPGAVWWTSVLAVRNLLVVLTAGLTIMWCWRRPASDPTPVAAQVVPEPS